MKKEKKFIVVYTESDINHIRNEEFLGTSKEDVINYIKEHPMIIGKLYHDIYILNIIEL